jgi:hypothetical protein
MRAPKPIVTLLALTLSLAACGGSKPEAEAPEPQGAGEEEKAPPPEGAEEAGEEHAEEEKAGAKAEDEKTEAPEPAKPVRSAKEIVLRPDVLYVPSLTASEPYKKAEKACAEKAKDDPKKKADCMTKATRGMDSDGIAFQQDKEGKLWWLTIQRKGGTLVTLHRIEFEVGDDGENKVTLKPKGPDKGKKPMGNIPRELTIEVSGESELVIQDPKQGRLVYEAKLGLLGDQQR